MMSVLYHDGNRALQDEFASRRTPLPMPAGTLPIAKQSAK